MQGENRFTNHSIKCNYSVGCKQGRNASHNWVTFRRIKLAKCTVGLEHEEKQWQ